MRALARAARQLQGREEPALVRERLRAILHLKCDAQQTAGAGHITLVDTIAGALDEVSRTIELSQDAVGIGTVEDSDRAIRVASSLECQTAREAVLRVREHAPGLGLQTHGQPEFGSRSSGVRGSKRGAEQTLGLSDSAIRQLERRLNAIGGRLLSAGDTHAGQEQGDRSQNRPRWLHPVILLPDLGRPRSDPH